MTNEPIKNTGPVGSVSCRCVSLLSVRNHSLIITYHSEIANRVFGKGTVEARIEALVENLAVALMQAENVAADASEYEVLAQTLAYALELADLGLSAESKVFDSLEPPKTL